MKFIQVQRGFEEAQPRAFWKVWQWNANDTSINQKGRPSGKPAAPAA